MTYQWKVKGLYPVEAQTAASELERIYDAYGQLDPADIVKESESETAPLHPCFEWDDGRAAQKYREHQAQGILRAIVTVAEAPSGPVETRAFVRTQEAYEPIAVAMQSEDKMVLLLKRAMSELHDFQRRYDSLAALQPVFRAIDSVERLAG